MDDRKDPFPFDRDGRRESNRLKAIHVDRAHLAELTPEMGTPDEWLWSALGHLKVQQDAAAQAGQTSVEVSDAALTLLMAKHEELLYGGSPWPWPEDDEPVDQSALMQNAIGNLVAVALGAAGDQSSLACIALIDAVARLIRDALDADSGTQRAEMLADYLRQLFAMPGESE